ncbi:MAG: DUF4173 domain-containing protein [Flavobacteriales bacterium]
MKRTTILFLLCLLMAGLFVFLFHGVGIGLNLILFEIVVVAILWRTRPRPFTPPARLALGGMLLTAIMVLMHGSLLTVAVNLISAGLAVGVLLAPELNALNRSAVLAVAHLAAVPLALFRTIPLPQRHSTGVGITPKGVLSVTLVPLVLLLFIAMYRASNPHFDQFMVKFFALFEHWDISLFISFLIGLLISGFLLLTTRNESLLLWAASGKDQLLPSNSMDPRVRGELLTGAVLLGGLNVLLLIANVLDITYVWIGFEFDGQYLKQFVHEGTYLLLLSILLGAAIVLYYFRGDLNFHRRNRVVKLLSYAWLAQNVVLSLSVGMRNFWYIHYYALAYKRIGVIFFLVALCIALVLVMIKVQRGRTNHFLLRTNAMAVYGIALVMALFNWDGIIARYNMDHREQAFVHLDFLSTLSDKALPYLVRSPEELERIAVHNKELIGGEERYSRHLYMTPESYRQVIDQRVHDLVTTYPERSWKELNLADARAYAALRGTGNE